MERIVLHISVYSWSLREEFYTCSDNEQHGEKILLVFFLYSTSFLGIHRITLIRQIARKKRVALKFHISFSSFFISCLFFLFRFFNSSTILSTNNNLYRFVSTPCSFSFFKVLFAKYRYLITNFMSSVFATSLRCLLYVMDVIETSQERLLSIDFLLCLSLENLFIPFSKCHWKRYTF